MKLIVMNGSSCSGKSTVIKNIMKEREGYFHLAYDSLKWQFSRYVSGKYYEDIHLMMLAMLEVLCKLKHNVICEAYHQGFREKLIILAKQYGYEVVEINLEANWKVLSQRFGERIAAAEANPEIKVANRTKERFKALYDLYEREKNPAAIVFRTDELSVEEVSSRVLKYL
jgi:predicted kinase